MNPRADLAGPVLVDTNVFGADLLRPTATLAQAYQPFLAGRAVLVSFATVAELRYGARRAGWGEQRLRRLDARIESAQVVWPGAGTGVRLRRAPTRVRQHWPWAQSPRP